MAKKGDGKKSGGNGKGSTKTIAQRELQSRLARGNNKGHKASSGRHQLDTRPVLGIPELIAGTVTTGHRIDIAGAMFDVNQGGSQLTLASSTIPSLGKFVKDAPNIFVRVFDLTKDEFTSPLRGAFAEKQLAMWQHVTGALTDEDVDALKARLQAERKAQKEKEAEELAQERAAQKFVGSNANIWNRASGSSKEAVEAAFTAMTADKPAEIRIGTVASDARYGIVLGFFFDQSTNSAKLFVGHVGEKTEYVGMIADGAHLRCWNGKLPETLPPTLVSSSVGDSVKTIHQIVMGLDRTIRDPIMNGMHHAVKRIVAVGSQKVVDINAKLKAAKTIADLAPAPESTTIKTAAQPAVAKTIEPKAEDLGASNRLTALIQGMKASGATPEEIGRAIAGFYSASDNAKSA